MQETEKFLAAEKATEELLETLAKLKNEAVSYKNSKNELSAVRENLISLINSIQNIAENTAESVKILNSIGGPEILRELRAIANKIDKTSSNNFVQIKATKKVAILSLIIGFFCLIGIIVLLMI